MTVTETPAPTTGEPEPTPAKGRRSLFRRPKHPWLTALAVVVVVVLVLELAVRRVEDQFTTLRAGDSAEMILKAERIHEISTDDRHIGAVFIGNSMMDTAISPAVFLKNSTTYSSAYNAAVVGAPLATRKRWVDEIVLRDLDPEVIVLGVHPVDLLYTDFLKLNQDPSQADVVFSRVLRETDRTFLGTIDRGLNDNVALVRDRGVLRKPQTLWEAASREVRGEAKPAEFEVRTEDQWRDWLKADGEVSLFHKEPFDPKSVKNMGPKLRENVVPANYNTTELQSLLAFLASTGKKVVLVIPPVPLQGWKDAGVDPGVLHQGNDLIRAMADQYHFRVIDFTDRGYKNAEFKDVLHANDLGTLHFSKDLAIEMDK